MNWSEIQDYVSAAAAQVTLIEGFAVLMGLVYVILAARESIWCWGAAIVSVSAYIYICVNANLYMETALQFFYLAMAIYGWLNWRRRNHQHKKPVIVWKAKWHIISIASGAALTVVAGYFLDRYTGASLAYLDSFTTIYALVATFMVTRKVLENWLYFIVIDAASVAMYAMKDLYLTALLFAAYVFIAAYGYFAWLKEYRRSYAA